MHATVDSNAGRRQSSTVLLEANMADEEEEWRCLRTKKFGVTELELVWNTRGADCVAGGRWDGKERSRAVEGV
jgi:hypothetical protein